MFSRTRKGQPPAPAAPRRGSARLRLEVLEDRAVPHVEGLDLLPPVSQADFVAVQSGGWSNPATWGGAVPIANDATGPTLDVVIPAGITVTVNGQFDAPDRRLDTLRVNGTLSFSTAVNTRLVAGTVVVDTTGVFRMGSVANPVRADRTAELVFTADSFAPGDTKQLGKGLIVNGQAHVYGAAKVAFAAVAGGYGAGSTALRLDVAPDGWRVGDEIALAATRFVRNQLQGETFRVRAITPDGTGYLVHLGRPDDASQPAALQFDHTPYPGQAVHVANLTRNAVIRSEDPSQGDLSRGHVMFVHTQRVTVQYAEFRELGRTDKKVRVDDATDAGPGANQRGRYPVHFHRGLDGATPNTPARVTGSVVNGSPGWGFVNHSSNIEFTNSVTWDVDGAGFVCEAGDEVGRFDGNLALQGRGAADGRFVARRFEGGNFQDGRIGTGDLGFTGDGFWVGSPGVAVVNNVAAGFQGRGFILWNMGLFETDRGETAGFRPDQLWRTDLRYRTFRDPGTPHHGRALPNDLPAREFRDNVSYASYIGFQVRFHNHPNLTTMKDSQVPLVTGTATYQPTVLSGLTAWNNEYGFTLSYVTNLRLVGATILSDQPFGTAIFADNAIAGTAVFRNTVIGGYAHAIDFGPDSPTYRLENFTYDLRGDSWVIRHGGRLLYPDDVPNG